MDDVHGEEPVTITIRNTRDLRVLQHLTSFLNDSRDRKFADGLPQRRRGLLDIRMLEFAS